MNEYKFKWLRLIWESFYTFFVFYIGYKLVLIPLLFIGKTEGSEQLIWIVVLGLMSFTIKFRIPKFYNFYRVSRYIDEE